MNNNLKSLKSDISVCATRDQRKKQNKASASSCASVDMIQALEEAIAKAGPDVPYKASDPIPTKLLSPFFKPQAASASSCASVDMTQALEEAIAKAKVGPDVPYKASDPIPTELLHAFPTAVTTSQNAVVRQSRDGTFFASSPQSESEAALDLVGKKAISK